MTRRARRTTAVGIAVALGAIAGAYFIHRGTGSDGDRLQGKWHLRSAVFDGEGVSGEKLKAMTVVVEGDRWTLLIASVPRSQYRLTLAPDKLPKEFDQEQLGPSGEPTAITVSTGRTEPIVRRGLYELDGDRLRVAMSQEGEGRPTSLDAGPGRLIYVYERMR